MENKRLLFVFAGLLLALAALATGQSKGQCDPEPVEPTSEAVCNDAADDDGDGLVDCADPDCDSACTASNGWPVSHAPGGYGGTGWAEGEYLPPYLLTDQFGSEDVSLTQFYGKMILLDLGAGWCAPCGDAAEGAEAMAAGLEAESAAWTFQRLTVLVDDNQPGADASGGWATATDAADWADDFGLTYPVLGGAETVSLAADASASSLPMIFVVDPTFQIRQVFVSFPGHEILAQAVRDAFAAFATENPGWSSPF